MSDERSEIFDMLEIHTELLLKPMETAVRMKRLEYSLSHRLKILFEVIRGLNIAGRAACAQWMFARIRRDDPHGLPVYFCLSKLQKSRSAVLDPQEFLVTLASDHPSTTPPPKHSEMIETRRLKQKLFDQRLKETITAAHAIRADIIDSIAKPMPTDLFTRASIFSGLSRKECTAAFLACISRQDTEWMVTAMSEAQNAKAHFAASDENVSYNDGVKLSESFIKAIQLHLKHEPLQEFKEIDKEVDSGRLAKLKAFAGIKKPERRTRKATSIVPKGFKLREGKIVDTTRKKAATPAPAESYNKIADKAAAAKKLTPQKSKEAASSRAPKPAAIAPSVPARKSSMSIPFAPK